MLRSLALALLTVTVLSVAALSAEDAPAPAQVEIRSAIEKALPLLEKCSAGSAKQRKCFTCHNQALPVFALAQARKQGFAVDEQNLARQIKHTLAHLKRGKKGYLAGKGQGGQADTAGYALWTLEAGEWAADETTAAVTEYLLQRHKDVDRWKRSSVRPPLEASDFTTTYLALRSLGSYGTEAQQPRIDARIEVVKKWLLTTEPKETEDRVCHLRSLDYVAADEDVIEKAAAQLVAEQRDDGGWAQLPKLKSDAYATGSVIVALMRAGGRSADDPAIVRGLSFLLKTQKDDGSWHVVTRSKPFQTYYESGFPHGKDQYISATASSWATLALLLSLPEK